MRQIIKTISRLFFCWFFLATAAFGQHPEYDSLTWFSSRGDSLLYRWLNPPQIEPGKKYPLVLFLHGAGERGADNISQLNHAGMIFTNPAAREKYPAFVLFPQCPEDLYWPAPKRPDGFWQERPFPLDAEISRPLALTKELLDNVIDTYPIDRDRIYIAGLSMGGMGTFDMVCRFPDLFAAAIPICGGIHTDRLNGFSSKTAFRIFHGDADPVVPVRFSREAYLKLKSEGADVEYVEFPGVDHDSWNPAFNRPDFMAWLFQQNLSNFPSGNEPEVNIVIGNETVSTGYLGNGIQWDPYDEAEMWGSSVSDEDWKKLFTRVDFMRPGYIRLMINSPFRYFDPETGKYDKTRNEESLVRLLRYCRDNDITVMYGEYNPPAWEMKADQRWVDMSVDYLNYLVNDLGFSCIKYFVIFNEPDGDWASTNGDYELWKSMLIRFSEKMDEYPGLSEKVRFASPDVVMDYKNPVSEFDAPGWIRKTAEDADSLVGLYDVHAYPGQHQVRSGRFADILANHKSGVPEGKKIVLGEAGYKYWREADSILMKEYRKRAEAHPFTRGSDANLLVYDYFYGLDMPFLCMEVMNAGYSGIAAWMLDDAMHSNGDSGNTKDIKLWGMWNILGEEVFNTPSEEEIRPWYYTWALMCRYFPQGGDILKPCFIGDVDDNLRVAVAVHNGRYTLAVVNVGEKDKELSVSFPEKIENLSLYVYRENQRPVNKDGHPVPVKTGIDIANRFKTKIKAQSFMLMTNME